MENNWKHYEKRFGLMTRYIYDHLDEKLDLNKLADIACLSPYHWHRIYHAVYGETIATTVKRLRLHQAAGYLANTSMTIPEVASKTGYENLQSFTRIFKSVYGMPPAQYRKQGSHTHFQNQLLDEDSVMHEINIKHIEKQQVVTVEHIGSYMQIGKAFDSLYSQLGMRNLMQANMRSIGLYYDDPSVVAEEQLHSRAGVIVEGNVEVDLPLEQTEIVPGRYAVLRHTGPYATMKAAYEWLYGHWLVNSSEEPANVPVFEEYLNNPRDTAPADLITDIYLPLKSTA